jgi:hypothetical protein
MEAINRKAVERTYHQLLAGYSTAYGLVASISSLPVLNAVFQVYTLRDGERFVKNVFRGGGDRGSDCVSSGKPRRSLNLAAGVLAMTVGLFTWLTLWRPLNQKAIFIRSKD